MMNARRLTFVVLILLSVVTSTVTSTDVYGQLSSMNRPLRPPVDVFHAHFSDPGTDYSTVPLWVWNDLLTEEDIRGSLRALASQNVKQVFIHPRPGLVTEYLSSDWFRLWRVALDEAKTLDMKIWIYDENSYPSGFAGGLVPEALPDSRAKSFILEQRSEKFSWDENRMLVVYELDDQGHYTDVTGRARHDGGLPAGDWLLVLRVDAENSSWYAGGFHVDLLKKGVTDKFLEITAERYRTELGDAFGNLIPGIFTDEPHLFAVDSGCWTEDLSSEMLSRYGFSFEEVAPILVRRDNHVTGTGRVITWKEARFAWYQTLLSMFVERWAAPYYRFCEENHLEFTGHYFEHAWPHAGHNPDTMALSAWQHRPAIDLLFNQYQTDHFDSFLVQFGNVRVVRELASLAHQLGRARTLSETYGASGWDLRFEDMKRIADWQYALGVNTTDEHLSFISMRGSRKYDHPQSFSPHASWWSDYHVMADYHTRASYFVSQGTSAIELLIIEPTTTGWLYQDGPELGSLAETFAQFINQLERAQTEYDLGSEDVLTRLAHVDEPALLTVGEAKYRHVVLPPQLENLGLTTFSLLATFAEKGGLVTRLGPLPLVNGRPIETFDEATRTRYRTLFDSARVQTTMSTPPGLRFLVPDADQPLVKDAFHHLRRHLPDGETLFLCNTQMDADIEGRVQIPSPEPGLVWAKAEQFDLESGEITPVPVRIITGDSGDRWTELDFLLPPCGSRAILFSQKTAADLPQLADSDHRKSESMVLEPLADPVVRREEPNVLVLDYCSLAIGGGQTPEDYVFRINQRLWQYAGLKNDPWFTAIQFRNEFMNLKLDDVPAFDATWRFFVDDDAASFFGPENPLEAVIESGDQYTIACNGQTATPLAGSWLDRSFCRFDITRFVQPGENRITLHAEQMTPVTELAPVYLRGNFALTATETGFLIQKSQPLAFGRDLNFAWKNQGMPFYPFGVSYTGQFQLDTISPADRYLVDLPRTGDLDGTASGRWNGAVADVRVNGQEAGCVWYEPCQKDVTSYLKPGVNEVTVTVVGTPRNLFGPHHVPGLRGTTSPGHYPAGPETLPPGRDYDTIPYGLLEPFVLRHEERK